MRVCYSRRCHSLIYLVIIFIQQLDICQMVLCRHGALVDLCGFCPAVGDCDVSTQPGSEEFNISKSLGSAMTESSLYSEVCEETHRRRCREHYKLHTVTPVEHAATHNATPITRIIESKKVVRKPPGPPLSAIPPPLAATPIPQRFSQQRKVRKRTTTPPQKGEIATQTSVVWKDVENRESQLKKEKQINSEHEKRLGAAVSQALDHMMKAEGAADKANSMFEAAVNLMKDVHLQQPTIVQQPVPYPVPIPQPSPQQIVTHAVQHYPIPVPIQEVVVQPAITQPVVDPIHFTDKDFVIDRLRNRMSRSSKISNASTEKESHDRPMFGAPPLRYHQQQHRQQQSQIAQQKRAVSRPQTNTVAGKLATVKIKRRSEADSTTIPSEIPDYQEVDSDHYSVPVIDFRSDHITPRNSATPISKEALEYHARLSNRTEDTLPPIEQNDSKFWSAFLNEWKKGTAEADKPYYRS